MNAEGARAEDLCADLLRAAGLRLVDRNWRCRLGEIDLIADFLLAKMVGKGPMDHATCVEFWGSDVDACRDLK